MVTMLGALHLLFAPTITDRDLPISLIGLIGLGEVQVVNSAQRDIWKPKERPDGRGPYNSVAANTIGNNGCVEYNEYIIYKGAQAYPEYIIFYKHEPDCACTHCKK